MLKKTIVPASNITSNTVFISNHLLALATVLKEVIYEKETSLRTIILVPSNHTKNFFSQHLTDSSEAFFGARFLSLAQGIEHFIKLSYPSSFSFPSFSSLSLHIESLLLNPTDDLYPLLSYLKNDKKKISSLSSELSHIFLYYGVYGGKALEAWEKKEGFQQTLWHKVKKIWDFPCHILQKPPEPKFPLHVIIFNIPHIPTLYKNFLDALSINWPITYFFKSPTPNYWGDLISDKAIARADLSFQSESISESERESFESLATDTNSLLANFGSLSKKMFLWLSEKESHEFFIPPKNETALAKIQKDIFSLSPTEKLVPDDSLQIHEASSRMREIEILVENLTKILKNGSLLPEEIVVFSKDLDLYFPFIQFIFEQDSCPLGYFISDLSALKTNPILKTVERFFSLVDSRFDVETIEDLLFSEPILKKQKFSSSELSLFHTLVEEMNIQWGFNHEMKKEVLEIEGVSERGSWKFAFEEMLQSLAYSSSMEISKFELLGNLIIFLETLFSDILSLKKTEASLSDWILILDTLLNKYFDESEEITFVLAEIHSFATLAKNIDSIFPFSSIHEVLKEIFAKKTFDRFYSQKPVIQFSNLSEVVNIDAKVIFILGLDEDSFPGKKVVRSLNELKGRIGSDHLPENAEKDRFYLLEALLLAKEKVILSYTGLSEKDGKPLEPSLCVQEICSNFNTNPIQKHPSLFFYPKQKKEPLSSPPQIDEPSLEIDIRHLIELMKHPVRFYCNRVLGIFLEKPIKQESREFFLSYLDRSLAKEAFFKQSKEDLFDIWERKNLLPTALFKECAKLELLEELEEIHRGFKNFDLNKDCFFSIYFDPACKQATFLDPSRFIHPSIQVTLENGKTFSLFGKLPSLSKKGIYLHKEFSISEFWKHIPHLAILNAIKSPANPFLLFGKDFVTKTSSIKLSSLVEYYLQAVEAPSPLLPDQIEKLLKKKLYSPTSFFDDPYLTFLAPDLSKNWDQWLNFIPNC